MKVRETQQVEGRINKLLDRIIEVDAPAEGQEPVDDKTKLHDWEEVK